MPITKFKNIDLKELDRHVWRYMPFSKYVSLLSYRALWFSKLNILEDKFEGAMPEKIDAQMRAEHQQFKKHFDPSMHQQIDDMNARNVSDGRELTTVSCWFGADTESRRMWDEYAVNSEGIAVLSTIRSLSQYVNCDPRLSQIGKVQYVDFSAHTMTAYEASQAQERALLKAKKYEWENEIRILTMSLRGPMCVGMDGNPLREDEWKGVGMNNFQHPGLYIKADLRQLVQKTVLAPGAAEWFENLVRKLARDFGLGPVERSSIEP